MAEQISISRETLRAELSDLKLSFNDAIAQLELRLIDRLADKAEVKALEVQFEALKQIAIVRGGPVDKKVDQLHDRVHTLEATNTGREYLIEDYKETKADVESLKTWRTRIGGAAALALFLAGLAVSIVVKHYL